MKRLSDNYLDDYKDDKGNMGFSLSLSSLTSPLKSIEEDISDMFKNILPSGTYEKASNYVELYKDVPQDFLTAEMEKQINVLTNDPALREMALRSGARATATSIADKLLQQYIDTKMLLDNGTLFSAMMSFKAPALPYVVGGLGSLIAYRMALKILLPSRR